MELAEKGSNRSLDITFADVVDEGQTNVDKKEESEDIYGKFKDMTPRPVFLWGKAVGHKMCKYDCSTQLLPKQPC